MIWTEASYMNLQEEIHIEFPDNDIHVHVCTFSFHQHRLLDKIPEFQISWETLPSHQTVSGVQAAGLEEAVGVV